MDLIDTEVSLGRKGRGQLGTAQRRVRHKTKSSWKPWVISWRYSQENCKSIDIPSRFQVSDADAKLKVEAAHLVVGGPVRAADPHPGSLSGRNPGTRRCGACMQLRQRHSGLALWSWPSKAGFGIWWELLTSRRDRDATLASDFLFSFQQSIFLSSRWPHLPCSTVYITSYLFDSFSCRFDHFYVQALQVMHWVLHHLTPAPASSDPVKPQRREVVKT